MYKQNIKYILLGPVLGLRGTTQKEGTMNSSAINNLFTRVQHLQQWSLEEPRPKIHHKLIKPSAGK